MDTSSNPVILFDGVCNYCNSMVNFVLRQDKKQSIRFATLQSPIAQTLLEQYGLPKDDFDSFVFIENNQAYLQSTAALKVMHHLPWYWKWTKAFWIVPRFARDRVYNFIARHRYRWFGKKESCMIPTPEIRNRFLN
jgi:predicted DCC family thiol-disulfide oxidoreductase YuxK